MILECGVCAQDAAGLDRVVRRVDIATPEGAPIRLYDLCKRAHDAGWSATPEDIRRTFQSLHHRPSGTVSRFKLLRGYTFTTVVERHVVKQPTSFEGAAEEAVAAGWELSERGWICPPCKTEAHRAAESDAGTGGLVTFFEETKDL